MKVNGQDRYIVKTRELMEKLQITPMDLVRLAKIGISTGYGAARNDYLSLDTLYRIYNGLRRAGYKIKFEDVVHIP